MNTILLVLLTITLSTASLVRGQSFCIGDLLPQYLTNGDFFSLQCNVPATTAGTNIMLGGRTGNPGDPMNQIYIMKGSVPANSKIYIQGPMDSLTASTSAPTNLTITEFTFVESLIEFFGFIPSDSIITISLCFMSRTTSHPSGDYGFLLHYYTLTFMARARLYVTQNTMKSYISGGAPMIVLQEGEMVLSINASLIIDNNIMEVGLAGAYNNAHISFQVNYQNTLSDGSLFAWRNNHFSGFCHTEFLTFWPVFSQSQGGDGGTVEISQNYFFYGPGTRYLNRMVGVSLPATFGPYMIGRIFVSFNTFNYSFPIQQDAEKGIIVVRPQTNFGGYYEIMHNVILDSTPPQCEVTSIYIEIPEATQWINITISDNTIVRQTAASRAFIYMTDAYRLTSSSSILTVSRNNFTSLETSPTRYILDGAFPYSSDVIQVCENLWYDISATRFTDSLPWYQVVFSIIVFCSSDTIPTTSTTPINPPPTTTTPPPPSRTTSTNPALWTSSSSTAPSRLTTTSPEGTTTVVPTRIEQTKTRSLANYIDDDLLDIRIEVPAIPPDVTSAIVGAGIIGGGGTSAGDVQALAIVSMSSCTNPSKSYRDNMIRTVSPIAVSNSCDGALIGNAILIVAAALWCGIGPLIAKKYLQNEKSSSWQSALAIVRAPSLFILSAVFSINSAAVCGSEYLHETQHKWAGALLWVWCVAVVVSLPLLAFLFGTRRYLVARHQSFLAKVFVPNGYFDIKAEGENQYANVYRCPPMMFSSVVGPYRYSSAIFSLTSILSSMAVWPVVLLPTGSVHCMGMYWFSTALHFIFSLVVVAIRPRRVFLFDLCQAISLLLNGILISLVAYQLGDGEHDDMLGDYYFTIVQSIEYVITALAIIRIVGGVALSVYNYRTGSPWTLAMDLIDGLLSANMRHVDTAWEYAGCLLNGKLKHKVETANIFSDMNLARYNASRPPNVKTYSSPQPIEMVDNNENVGDQNSYTEHDAKNAFQVSHLSQTHNLGAIPENNPSPGDSRTKIEPAGEISTKETEASVFSCDVSESIPVGDLANKEMVEPMCPKPRSTTATMGQIQEKFDSTHSKCTSDSSEKDFSSIDSEDENYKNL